MRGGILANAQLASGFGRRADLHLLFLMPLLSTPTEKQVPDSLVAYDRRCESDLPQQPKPHRSPEEAMGLAFVNDLHVSTPVAEQDSEVNQDSRVAWVRIRCPLQVTDASILSIVPAVVCTWNKGFTELIGHEESNSSRPTVSECRLHNRPQIRFGGHVADRVVNKDCVKGFAQPQSSYIA